MSGSATILINTFPTFVGNDHTSLEKKSSYNDSKKGNIIEINDISLDDIYISKKEKFMSFAGIWKNVDTEKIKKNIYLARGKTSRPIKTM